MRCRRLKDAHGLLAVKESAYNKARTAAEAGRDKLPNLQGQADEAARIAHASALAAQEHAGGARLPDLAVACYHMVNRGGARRARVRAGCAGACWGCVPARFGAHTVICVSMRRRASRVRPRWPRRSTLGVRFFY